MTGKHNRAAIYLRVSRDDQTTDNQRLVLAKVAEHRGWIIVQTYEDQGIAGAKGRDQRPAFDTMLKDAVQRRFDILMVWSIDRLGRSVLHVVNALAELDAAGVALYSDQQAIDSTTPSGRAMIQMASVFGEQERSIIRSRVDGRAGSRPAARQEAWPPRCDDVRRPIQPPSGAWRLRAPNPRRSLCRRGPGSVGSFPSVLKKCLFAAHRRTQTVRPNRLRLAKLETGPNCSRGSPATIAQIRSAGFFVCQSNHEG